VIFPEGESFAFHVKWRKRAQHQRSGTIRKSAAILMRDEELVMLEINLTAAFCHASIPSGDAGGGRWFSTALDGGSRSEWFNIPSRGSEICFLSTRNRA
jgi:hypothetical protein